MIRCLRTWALLVAGLPLGAQTREVYRSPDGVLQAVVWTGATGESRVEIQTASGRKLLVRNEVSMDGSHGQCIVHAAWTADAQFFVADTESSGGHQSWARPIWVYSRAQRQIVELGKRGAIAVTDFRLSPPDVLETKVLDCERGKEDLEPKRLRIRLHEVIAKGRLQ